MIQYIGMKTESYMACFRDDAISNPDIVVGVMIAIEYCDNKFSMVRVNWGPEEEWEYDFDGAVEQHWLFNEENTLKLMARMGASNGKELIETIYQRFKEHSSEADYVIEDWCKAEGINYFFYYHREMTHEMEEKLHKIRKSLF